MLENIKNYRKSPKRLVLTIKMNECVCLNRLGDLNTARKAKLGQDEAKDTSDAHENSLQDVKKMKQGAKGSIAEESTVAFKPYDNCSCADDEMYIGEECDCGDKKEFCLPCGTFDAKGGINCEKTLRILLCDAVAGVLMAFGACAVTKSVISELGKGK